MSDYGTSRPKRRHTFLKLLIVLLLAAVVGFVGWLGYSFKRVGNLFGQVGTAYNQMEASIEAQDYSAALAYARSAASSASEASAELAGTPWDIAAHVPVLGSDVATLRAVGGISGSLADDAVLPVLDAWDDLAADGIVSDGNVDVSKVSEKLGQFVSLAKTLQSAGAVVDECSTQVNALPISRFAALNDWVAQLKGTISSIDEAFDQIGVVVDLVVNLSSALSSLAG